MGFADVSILAIAEADLRLLAGVYLGAIALGVGSFLPPIATVQLPL
jgi:hypothetical protein